MTEKYGSSLRLVAEQGVVSFRDVLLGALQFNLPGVITRELNWLDRLLEARQINREKVPIFLDIFTSRIRADLSAEEAAPLLKIIESAQARFPHQK